MKILLTILVITVCSLFIYSYFSDKFPCTREVKWGSTNNNQKVQAGLINRDETFNFDRLELTVNWNFMSLKQTPEMLLALRNKGLEELRVNDIKIYFLRNGKSIPIEKIVTNDFEECTAQPCKVWQLPTPFSVTLKPTSYFRADYYFEDYSMRPLHEVSFSKLI